MAVSIVMPALEMAQDTGKLISWRKNEGERVTKGEALLEIETDKAVVEIEAPGDGILAGVTAHEGAVIPVGQTIAWLVQPGEAVPVETHCASPPASVSISPKARRLAKEHGVDLATVRGSGPGGEIVAEDILGAAQSAIRPSTSSGRPEPAEGRDPQSAMSSVGRLMAERTTHSWTTVPHFFLTREVDASGLVAARSRFADATITDLLLALVARVLGKHPRMNASWTGDGIRLNADVNVAVAIAVTDAVVTGVVHHADRASVAGIAVQRTMLTERARAGKLQPADISGATFTISNLGMYRVDAFTAIIVPPQAGILAVGAVVDRVVAVDGKPAVRPTMNLTLSCDHRVVDGARAAEFLSDVVEVIRDPERDLKSEV